MYLALTAEQELLSEAAQGALSRVDTLAGARGALDALPAPDLWELACAAGWPGLLSGEQVDGAGLGAYEAALLLQECGARLADARLLGHLPATAMLELAASDEDRRSALARGAARAALLHGGGDQIVARDGGEQTLLDGRLLSVLDAYGADVFVALATAQGGRPIACVFDADAEGVAVTAAGAYDATRSIGDVSLQAVPARALQVPPQRLRDGIDLQRLLLASEAVGAADACLQMARGYALERVAFGRQIGSFQAIKHKLVEMLRRIENARSLVIGASRAWGRDTGQFALLANAARVTATDALGYCSAENIFIHGGVGATWEHDAQLYYRRAELSRRLAGGADAAARRVALELQAGRVPSSPAPRTATTNNGRS